MTSTTIDTIEPVNNFETNARRSRDVATTRTSRGSVEAHGQAPPKRRVMDIEDVVIWALRDEMPKAERGDGGGGEPCAVSPMFRGADLGCRIDNWSREPGFPLAMGAPHPDALKVAAAIERLARFRTHDFDEVLELGPDFAADPADEAKAMSDAFRVVDSLVVRFAKLRQRPFWQSRPTISKVTQTNGRPVVLRWEVQMRPTRTSDNGVATELLMPVTTEKRDSYPLGSYCPLQYDQDPKMILSERAQYLVWWAGLNALAGDLFEQLDTIAVLPPSAAQKPWLGERELGKPPRIFEDLTARVYQKEIRETAAAHRALGLRRFHAGGRRGSSATPIARRPAAQLAMAYGRT